MVLLTVVAESSEVTTVALVAAGVFTEGISGAVPGVTVPINVIVYEEFLIVIVTSI